MSSELCGDVTSSFGTSNGRLTTLLLRKPSERESIVNPFLYTENPVRVLDDSFELLLLLLLLAMVVVLL